MNPPEYDGPRVRYDDGMSVAAVIPFAGLLVGLGAFGFLAGRAGEGEVAKVPAQARGTVRVAVYSHLLYGLLVAGWFLL